MSGISGNYLVDLLKLFNIEFSRYKFPMLIRYEALSPDSFVHLFRSGDQDEIFAIYQEDAVNDYEEVKQQVESTTGGKIVEEFTPIAREDKPNHFYKNTPEGWPQIADHAAGYSYFYLFLFKISEPQCSEYFKD